MRKEEGIYFCSPHFRSNNKFHTIQENSGQISLEILVCDSSVLWRVDLLFPIIYPIVSATFRSSTVANSKLKGRLPEKHEYQSTFPSVIGTENPPLLLNIIYKKIEDDFPFIELFLQVVVVGFLGSLAMF